MTTNARIVECPCCGGEGRLFEPYCDWQHGPGEIDVGRCEECEGTGGAVIETEPVELSDLQEEESVTDMPWCTFCQSWHGPSAQCRTDGFREVEWDEFFAKIGPLNVHPQLNRPYETAWVTPDQIELARSFPGWRNPGDPKRYFLKT